MPELSTSKKIKHIDTGDSADLICPRCGGDYLHHQSVVMFDRAEDDELATRSIVSGSKMILDIVNSKDAGNPSRRRGGLVIQFCCEHCEAKDGPTQIIELTIAQHKGSTEIGWRFSPLSVTDRGAGK